MSNKRDKIKPQNMTDYIGKEVIIDVGKESKRLMPRWQKRLLIGLAIFTLLSALAAYFMRINLFKELIKPTIPFQIAEQPTKPQYEDSSAWAQRPQTISENPNEIAVFFIHPTSYYNGKMGWNAPIDEARSLERLEKIIVPNHAIPFEKAGELWIPKYRQATLYSQLSFSEDAKDALNLAYSDVETAFDNFIKARGKDKGFIIVGVGQGGLHGLRLIQSKIAHTQIEKSLVAGYLIDQAVPLGDKITGVAAGLDGHQSPIKMSEFHKEMFGDIANCSEPSQSNCILSFSVFDRGEKGQYERFGKRALIWSKAHGYSGLGGRAALCINPLNNDAYSKAPAKLNLGSAAASGLEKGIAPALLPGETGAECLNSTGILLVDKSRAAVLKPNRYELGAHFKTQAYNLFYKSLETDALRRAEAYKVKKN